MDEMRWGDLVALALVLVTVVLLVVCGHAQGAVLLAASQFVLTGCLIWRKRR
jgi:Na+-transporting NADH:ubiquinone oxidoreductase subunit NqrD